MVLILVGLVLGCTEPNPYAQASAGETGSATTGDPTAGDSGTTGDPTTTGDPPGCGDPACSLGLAVVEFSVQGNDVFSTSIAKPTDQTSVPIAAVHRYDSGQTETLGYAIAWTDEGDSWGLEVTTTGAAANSRVSGVAAVIGLGQDFPAPELHELEISTADGCGQLTSSALAGRVFVDSIERYSPGDATVLEVARTATVTDVASVEYCLTQPDNLDATLGVKLVAFDLPEGALAAELSRTLDSANAAMDSFAEFGDVSTIAHLVSARGLLEAPAPKLGWRIDCAGQAPYACTSTALDFTTGAAVEVGGLVLAIQ